MTLAAIAARLRPAPRLPGLWLMTGAWDEAETMAAMRDLPRGAGVVFRHYDAADRAALGRRLAALARARCLVFVVAGDPALAFRLRADGFHAPEALLHRISAWRRLAPHGLATAAAHGDRALRKAREAGADAVFLSPIFATASHPGAPHLGPARFAALAARADLPVVALGGVDAAGARRLLPAKPAGFAAIGALRSRTRVP